MNKQLILHYLIISIAGLISGIAAIAMFGDGTANPESFSWFGLNGSMAKNSAFCFIFLGVVVFIQSIRLYNLEKIHSLESNRRDTRDSRRENDPRDLRDSRQSSDIRDARDARLPSDPRDQKDENETERNNNVTDHDQEL